MSEFISEEEQQRKKERTEQRFQECAAIYVDFMQGRPSIKEDGTSITGDDVMQATGLNSSELAEAMVRTRLSTVNGVFNAKLRHAGDDLVDAEIVRHDPAPWAVDDRTYDDNLTRISTRDRGYVSVRCRNGNGHQVVTEMLAGYDAAEANIRLVVEAPDLLACLQEVLEDRRKAHSADWELRATQLVRRVVYGEQAP